MTELNDELQDELTFLMRFQGLHHHAFTVENGHVNILDRTYYGYLQVTMPSIRGQPVYINGSEKALKKLNGEKLIISVPNIAAKIYELKNLHMYKIPPCSEDYSTILICHGVASTDDRVKKLYREHEYDINEWYREDYHFVNNVNLL